MKKLATVHDFTFVEEQSTERRGSGNETKSLEKSRCVISFLTEKRKLEKSGRTTLGNFCPGDRSSASKVASVSTYGNNPNLFLFVVTSPFTIFLFATSTSPLHKIDGSHKSKNNIYSGKTRVCWRVNGDVSFVQTAPERKQPYHLLNRVYLVV